MFAKLFVGFLVVVAVLAGYLWSNQAEIVANFNEQRSLEREQSQQAGRLFGEKNDQNACLTRTLADFDGCQEFGCSVSSGLFLKNCGYPEYLVDLWVSWGGNNSPLHRIPWLICHSGH